MPSGTEVDGVAVTVDDSDVTGQFAMRPNGRYQGLVTGLAEGESVLRAEAGRHADEVVITNHPSGGPVFSGPQIEPWQWQPTAVNEQCDQPEQHQLFYRSTNPAHGFREYDEEDPPPDVAMATTENGVEVPFIVRVETGYQNRDQYKIATLYQPGEGWELWEPQPQWNRKVLMTHGANCGAHYGAGTAPDVLADNISTGLAPVDELGGMDSVPLALERGFAVVSTAAMEQGKIAREQFVDLNEKVGGLDIDINRTQERVQGDTHALHNAYRSGAINNANNLSGVAIIDHGGPDPGPAHDAPLDEKIVRQRPADVTDRCSQVSGMEEIGLPGLGPLCELPLVQTRLGTPRTVAGDGAESDINACSRKPLRRADFYPPEFDDEQWQRLTETFPDGVCDFSQPGIGQQDTVAWQTYAACSGGAAPGGRPLDPAPATRNS